MTWRSWLAFGALGVVWGLPYFFIKLALADISPVGIAWGRIALGAAILLPIAWKRGALRSLAGHKGRSLHMPSRSSSDRSRSSRSGRAGSAHRSRESSLRLCH